MIIRAALLSVALGLATAGAAQAQPAAPAAPAAAGPITTDKTPIGEIIKNPAAKAALESALPEISGYYDQIGSMTLAEVAPMSQGALDDAKLKALQVEFDKIK